MVASVGGTDPRAERRQLDLGAHIVVGTPGRLRDHLERGNLDLSALRVAVLDEADEMLDMGFRDELEAILDVTPATRRTLLFSATIPREIGDLAKRYQKTALRIAATGEGGGHADIAYQAVLVAPREAERALVNLLRWHDTRAIVFCATRAAVARLHGNLTERGFNAVALSGELTQAERNRALQSLRDGRAQICVATDVAARGLDLPDLGLVVHAELPRDRETLQHRSGRTGRAGRKGTALLLVPHSRRRLVERLLASARIQAEWVAPPSAEQIRARDNDRLVAEAIAAAQAIDPESLPLARTVLDSATPEAIAAALLRALGSALPAPEELEPAVAAPRERTAPRADISPEDATREGVWFRLNVGRNRNADPRWLLPFLCRRGHVTRQEIGRISVLERETRVEIAPWAADRFAAAAGRPDEQDEDIRIVPVHDVPGDAARPVATPHPAPHVEPRPAPRGEPRPAPRGESRTAPRGGPRPTPHGEPRPAPRGGPRPTPHGEPRPAPRGGDSPLRRKRR